MQDKRDGQAMWAELLARGRQAEEKTQILACNEKTAEFGLVLSEEETRLLLERRQNSLREQRRVEFGEGILIKLIEAFCDSEYLEQEHYAETLGELQEVFYLYKNEAHDCLSDDELLTFMREQFDDVCFGSVEYLAETCLERFARAIRAGYTGYLASGGSGEYSRLSEEKRWDRELYMEVLHELFW